MKATKGEVLYHLLKPFGLAYFKGKYRLEILSNPLQDLREPYLLVGHHVHNADPVISNGCARTLIRYIAGDANQDDWLKRNLLKVLESVPFAKNRADAKAIRELMKHVKAGRPIGLYPEGGRTWDGTTDYIIPSTAKLIKMFNLPVYAAFHKGGFLSDPRWCSHPRRSKILVEIRQIFDRGAIAQKSSEELYQELVQALAYNEFQWQNTARIPFPGNNLAEHIERLLYMCPECGGVNSHKSQGDNFRCTACQQGYSLDVYGFINGGKFQDTAEWNKWQRIHLPRLVQEGFAFISKDIEVERIAKTGRQRFSAQVTLTPEKVIITHQEIEEVPLAKLTSLSITYKDTVEFYLGTTKFRLLFDPTKEHVSIKLFYDLIFHIKEGSNQ